MRHHGGNIAPLTRPKLQEMPGSVSQQENLPGRRVLNELFIRLNEWVIRFANSLKWIANLFERIVNSAVERIANSLELLKFYYFLKI